MKEKIKALFKEYYNDQNMPAVELEDKVLALFDVVGRREQLVCPECKSSNIEIRHKQQSFKCNDCKEGWAN